MGTFYGLEMARKALFAQQSAIYTTGHNIANANTEGYSRQRVNFSTTTPFPAPSRVQPQIAGQMGTGVEIGSVQRIRDQFLDSQFRTENSKLGYWETTSTALKRMENLMNEPTDQGLAEVMNSFWQSLNDLAVNPDNTGARSVVAQNGLAVAETFNYLSKNLQSIQADLKSQIEVMGQKSDSQINSLLRQINDINIQVQKIEPHGYVANDLYDKRDVLIDELSQLVNIKVHRHESSSSASDIADGIVSIELVKEDGSSFGTDGIYLIDANNDDTELSDAVNEMRIDFDNDGKVSEITIGENDENVLNNILQSTGSLSALIEANGYDGDGEEFNYPHMLEKLNKLAKSFAKEFNKIHRDGKGLDEEDTGINFFVNTEDNETENVNAGSITVNPDLLKNPNKIAAGDRDGGTQNGDNARKLAGVFDNTLTSTEEDEIDGTSIRKFFTSLIGEVGVNARESNRMKENTSILQMQVDHERMSVSAVSLDEEFTNLIKFQHAYNAAARNITAVDEMIDRIINNMGLVGR